MPPRDAPCVAIMANEELSRLQMTPSLSPSAPKPVANPFGVEAAIYNFGFVFFASTGQGGWAFLFLGMGLLSAWLSSHPPK